MKNNTEKGKKKYQGMTYRQLQRWNSKHRARLSIKDLNNLKNNQYTNKGWVNIISLYEKLKEIVRKQEIYEMSLEELFLESDRIGNKYQSMEEKKEFQQEFRKTLEEISVESDHYFPDNEYEFIDFSKN